MVELRRGIDWDNWLVNLRRALGEEDLMRKDVCTEVEILTESRSTEASFFVVLELREGVIQGRFLGIHHCYR